MPAGRPPASGTPANAQPGPSSRGLSFSGPPVEQPSLVPGNLATGNATFNLPGTVAQQQAAAVGTPNSSFRLGGVTITLGGFVEMAGFYRSRNETSDLVSNFNTGIPLPQSPNYRLGEFRASVRPSLVSLLVQGKPTADLTIGSYLEADFLAAPVSANRLQLNGYSPRLRQAYATYDDLGTGLHVLAGQSWSLLTMNQAGANGAPNGAGTATYQNAGGVDLSTTAAYSTDIAPDVIGKVAYDPGWGHYEVYGLLRLLHDRVSTPGAGHNSTVLAGGAGG